MSIGPGRQRAERPAAGREVTLLDLEPYAGLDAAEVLEGLCAARKYAQPKYFYDEAGSKLFERICEQPEYYPPRIEKAIMAAHADEMAAQMADRAVLIEPGSGSSAKTRLLLDRLPELSAYVPVDISKRFLLSTARQLAQDYPGLAVLPVCADFAQRLDLPEEVQDIAQRVVYFPGSTIGNLAQREAVEVLRRFRAIGGPRGTLLIGVDLLKPAGDLERAYNDAAGVTAAFNLNLLTRFNRELGADFELDAFRHEAVFDRGQSRIEMRLVSLCDQQVRVAERSIDFRCGEYIVTEHSHKYSPAAFEELTRTAGFRVCKTWRDRRQWFSVQYLCADA